MTSALSERCADRHTTLQCLPEGSNLAAWDFTPALYQMS